MLPTPVKVCPLLQVVWMPNCEHVTWAKAWCAAAEIQQTAIVAAATLMAFLPAWHCRGEGSNKETGFGACTAGPSVAIALCFAGMFFPCRGPAIIRSSTTGYPR